MDDKQLVVTHSAFLAYYQGITAPVVTGDLGQDFSRMC